MKIALSLVACLSLTACYTTSSSMAPTGEPLRVDIQSNKEPFTKQKTRYEAGQYAWLDGFYQGETLLTDELDFYHVAGDTEKEQTLIEHRTKKNFAFVVSWGGGGLGAGLIAAPLIYMAATGQFQDGQLEKFIGTPVGQAAFGAIAVGGVVMATAPLAAFLFFGPKTDTFVEEKAPGGYSYELMYPKEVAQQVAAGYNEKLGVPTATPAGDPAAPAEAPATEAPAAAPAATTGTLSFTLASTEVRAGDKLVVRFDRPVSTPSGQQHWITLVKEGAADSEYGTWHYVKAGATEDELVPAAAGVYEVRLHDLYPQNQSKVMQRVRVTVK